MKLGGLLSEIKGEKSRLSRLMDISNEILYVEENKEPKLNYKEISQEIQDLIVEIRKQKLKVQEANLKNKVEGYDMTLAEAILKVGDYRSLIKHKTNLIQYAKESSWFSNEKRVNYVPQIKEKEIEKEIQKLVQQKIKLDNAIQKTNWNIEISD